MSALSVDKVVSVDSFPSRIKAEVCMVTEYCLFSTSMSGVLFWHT